MFGWLAIALLVVPIIELVVVLRVGSALGALPTIGLLIAISVLGAFLLKSQGRRTIAELSGSLRRGRNPTGPISDGAMLIFAAALLLTPGFFTDAVGFALLLPPVRAVLRPVLTAAAMKSVANGRTRVVRFDGRGGVVDIDGSAVTDDIDDFDDVSGRRPDDPFSSPPPLG